MTRPYVLVTGRFAFMLVDAEAAETVYVVGTATQSWWRRRNRWRADLWNFIERERDGDRHAWRPLPLGRYDTFEDALDVLHAAWEVRV